MAGITATYTNPTKVTVTGGDLIAYDLAAVVTFSGFTFTEGTTYYAELTKAGGIGGLATRATIATATATFNLANVNIDREFRQGSREKPLAARITVYASGGTAVASFAVDIQPGAPADATVLATVGWPGCSQAVAESLDAIVLAAAVAAIATANSLDITFTDTKGPVFTDRTTGTKFRLYYDNGMMDREIVT